MRIIKPSYEILTPINGIEMLRHIEKIGRVCYKSEDKITEDGESAKRFVKMLIERGHEAMIEHSMISVKFTVDRGVSHELVRHRIASFAQESTRYCDYSKSKFGREITVIQPCWIRSNLTGSHKIEWYDSAPSYSDDIIFTDASDVRWLDNMARAEKDYFALLDYGWSAQQARSVLPNSLKTEITMTMNFRGWRHFFGLRIPITAHPQMREVTRPLLADFKSQIPVIFDDIELPED